MEILPEQTHKNSFFALLKNQKRCAEGNLASHLTTGHILQRAEENSLNPYVCPDKQCQCRKIIFESYIGRYGHQEVCKLFSIDDLVRQTNAEIQNIDTAIYDFEYGKMMKMFDILVREIELKRDQLKERIESKDISLYLSPQCYEVYQQFRSGENGFKQFQSKNECFANDWRVSMDKREFQRILYDFVQFKSEIVRRLSKSEFRKKEQNEVRKRFQLRIFNQKAGSVSQSLRQKELQIERDQLLLKKCSLNNTNPEIAHDVQLQPERIQALSLQSNDLHLLQGSEFSNLRKLSLSISLEGKEDLSNSEDLFCNLKYLRLNICNDFDSAILTSKFQEIYDRGGLRVIETVSVDCPNFAFPWIQMVRSVTALIIETVSLEVAALDSVLVGLELQVLILGFKNKPKRYEDSDEEGYYYSREPEAKEDDNLPKPILSFSNLKHLRVFHLSTAYYDARRHDFQEGEFENLCLSFPFIVELDLSHQAISEEMCILISKHFGCLERLKMVCCGVTNKHVCYISNGVYRLKVLDVSNDQDGNYRWRSRMSTSWNSIGNRGFQMIIEGQPHLQALNVSNQCSSRTLSTSSFLKLHKHLPKLCQFSIMFEYYDNFNFVYGLSKIKSVNINLEHSKFLESEYRNQKKARKLEQLTCHHKSIFKLVNNSGCPMSLLSRINSFGEIKDRANRNLVLLMGLKQRQQQTDFFYKVEGQDGD